MSPENGKISGRKPASLKAVPEVGFGIMSLLTPDSPVGTHLTRRKLIAVLSIGHAELAAPMARALLEGGIDCIELTLRSDAALDSIREIASGVPGMVIGAGTILSEIQVDQVLEAGARFGVAPSVNRRVLRHARESGLPFSPGVMTPTDIDVSLQEDCHLLKYFPATSAGGIAHLKNIAAPFAHLGIGFIPLGGISESNLGEWLAAPGVSAVGGSWLAPTDLVESEDWTAITALAQRARQIVEGTG